MGAEILAQSSRSQEFVQGFLLVALLTAPVKPAERSSPSASGESTGAQPG